MPISRVVRSLEIGVLRERLWYDKEAGTFIWAISGRGLPGAGKIAGSQAAGGYWRIHILGVTYLAHRLAWFYVYGTWPTCEIDHINGNRTDNRIENLRDVSVAENRQNQRRAQRTSQHGFLGAHFDKRKRVWRARIHHQGKYLSLGHHETPQEAHAAYIAAKRRLHPGCMI